MPIGIVKASNSLLVNAAGRKLRRSHSPQLDYALERRRDLSHALVCYGMSAMICLWVCVCVRSGEKQESHGWPT